ncbi:MAG: hypothetical protein ACI4AK_09290 [Lepagella sp.]
MDKKCVGSDNAESFRLRGLSLWFFIVNLALMALGFSSKSDSFGIGYGIITLISIFFIIKYILTLRTKEGWKKKVLTCKGLDIGAPLVFFTVFFSGFIPTEWREILSIVILGIAGLLTIYQLIKESLSYCRRSS